MLDPRGTPQIRAIPVGGNFLSTLDRFPRRHCPFPAPQQPQRLARFPDRQSLSPQPGELLLQGFGNGEASFEVPKIGLFPTPQEDFQRTGTGATGTRKVCECEEIIGPSSHESYCSGGNFASSVLSRIRPVRISACYSGDGRVVNLQEARYFDFVKAQ